jgi:hypothetical protein
VLPSGGWRRAAPPAITSIYVIVPVTSGKMTIVAPNGERSRAQLGLGKSYFRKAGVEHDVLNESADEIVFLEVELKP